jgi:hypothetical protein
MSSISMTWEGRIGVEAKGMSTSLISSTVTDVAQKGLLITGEALFCFLIGGSRTTVSTTNGDGLRLGSGDLELPLTLGPSGLRWIGSGNVEVFAIGDRFSSTGGGLDRLLPWNQPVS